MDPATQWATLAMVAGIALDKMATKCDLYPAGVKSLHCSASQCLQFDVERATPTPTPILASRVQTQAPSPQLLTPTSTVSSDPVSQAAIKLEGLTNPPASVLQIMQTS